MIYESLFRWRRTDTNDRANHLLKRQSSEAKAAVELTLRHITAVSDQQVDHISAAHENGLLDVAHAVLVAVIDVDVQIVQQTFHRLDVASRRGYLHRVDQPVLPSLVVGRTSVPNGCLGSILISACSRWRQAKLGRPVVVVAVGHRLRWLVKTRVRGHI